MKIIASTFLLVGFTDALRGVAIIGKDRMNAEGIRALPTSVFASKAAFGKGIALISPTGKGVVEDYFNYWNERDMTSATEHQYFHLHLLKLNPGRI